MMNKKIVLGFWLAAVMVAPSRAVPALDQAVQLLSSGIQEASLSPDAHAALVQDCAQLKYYCSGLSLTSLIAAYHLLYPANQTPQPEVQEKKESHKIRSFIGYVAAIVGIAGLIGAYQYHTLHMHAKKIMHNHHCSGFELCGDKQCKVVVDLPWWA